jgi:hypothetical protein
MAKYKSAAMRRYLLRLSAAMAAYIVTLSAALRFVGGHTVTGPLAYILALLPGLSIAGVFWAIGRLMVEEKDEYVRMLFVRQSLVATAFTLSITTMWGFLENFDLVPHVDAFYIAVLWFAGLGLGSCVNWLTLRDTTDCSR